LLNDRPNQTTNWKQPFRENGSVVLLKKKNSRITDMEEKSATINEKDLRTADSPSASLGTLP